MYPRPRKPLAGNEKGDCAAAMKDGKMEPGVIQANAAASFLPAGS